MAQAAQFASLLPRLAMAMGQACCRQLREVSGIDHSLIDDHGVAAASRQFMLAWWPDRVRACAAQTDLVARSLSLLAGTRDGNRQIEARPDADKRFLDKAWREEPALALAKDFRPMCPSSTPKVRTSPLTTRGDSLLSGFANLVRIWSRAPAFSDHTQRSHRVRA